jgi:TRAP-type C4-dicarboxylate transport system permease small subunit
VIRYLVFTIGLFGAATAAQSERLFNIDMMTRLAGKKGKLVIRVVTSIFTVYACEVFIRGAWTLKRISLAGEVSDRAISPVVAVYILVAALSLVAAHMTLHACEDLYYLLTGVLPPESLVVHGTAIDTDDTIDGLTEQEHMRAFAKCAKCGDENPPRTSRLVLALAVTTCYGGLLGGLIAGLMKRYAGIIAGAAVFGVMLAFLTVWNAHRCAKCGAVRK